MYRCVLTLPARQSLKVTHTEKVTHTAFWAAFGAEFEALGLSTRRLARAILGTQLKNAQTSPTDS